MAETGSGILVLLFIVFLVLGLFFIYCVIKVWLMLLWFITKKEPEEKN